MRNADANVAERAWSVHSPYANDRSSYANVRSSYANDRHTAHDIDTALLQKCQIDAVCSISVCAYKPDIWKPIPFLRYFYLIY